MSFTAKQRIWGGDAFRPERGRSARVSRGRDGRAPSKGHDQRIRRRFVAALGLAAIAALSATALAKDAARPVRVQVQVKVQMRAGVRRAAAREFETPSAAGLLLAERRDVQRLRAATELIGQEKYAEAAEVLQRLLETDEDRFFRPDQDDRHVHRSLKLEVQRLLAESPAELRAAYERQFGPVARTLLNEALQTGRSDTIEEVARLFFHTAAGQQATYQLAQHARDRGDPLLAALWFERLRRQPAAAARYEPALSLQTAWCWSRAGQPEPAAKVLRELRQSQGGAALTIGGRRIEPAGDGLTAAFGPAPRTATGTSDQWTVYRGNAARNPVVANVIAADSPVAWCRELLIPRGILWDDATQQVQTEVRGLLTGGSRSGLPRRFPLVVGDRVIARTLGNVAVLDLRTGETATETFQDGTIDAILRKFDGSGPAAPSAGLRQLLSVLARQRTWDDATFGALSSDGQYVYCIEETGVAGPFTDAGPPAPVSPARHNRLACYRLTDGKLVGSLGRDRGPVPGASRLGETFFLGPPLPLGGRLYCLVESRGEIQLVVLQPRHDSRRQWAEAVWVQSLMADPGGSDAILHDGYRRVLGTAPSYADGVLICPTAVGAVIAVDVTTRSLLWAYSLESAAAADPLSSPVPVPANAPRAPWREPVAVIAEGRVLLTPPDSAAVRCLDLRDGSLKWEQALLWKEPLRETHYLAGVADRRVIFVGPDDVQALNLDDGSAAWTTKIGGPASGRGFIAGQRLYVPLASGKIAVLETTTGRLLTEAPVPEEHIPGNLVPHRGLIVSQNPTEVAVFPLPEIPDDSAK